MADSKFKFNDFAEGIAGAFLIAAAILTPFLRLWRTKWGATDAEIHRSLPGDDLVPHSKWGWTHAITICASAAEVWPWLMQMGQDRGGLYSYEWLENRVGCDIHNADRIIPEFQHLEVTTRLISRWRGDYNPSLGNALIYRVLTEPISLVMDRKMLLGIKRRAEAAAER
jgi:hypothetical protein